MLTFARPIDGLEGPSPKMYEFPDLFRLSRLPPNLIKVHFPLQLLCAPVSIKKTDLPGPLMWKLIDLEPDLLFWFLRSRGDLSELSRLAYPWCDPGTYA